MFAFWKYDLFPYLLGGTVVKTRKEKDGIWAETKEYGRGYCFRVAFFLPTKIGKKLKEELETLRSEKDIETKKIHEKYKNKKSELLKLYGVYGATYE
jgi:hypothetical protein